MAPRLMIVEDDEGTRELLEMRAELEGLDFIAFSSGVEALKYLGNCIQDDLPDAYLVDMRLDDPFDGNPAELAASKRICDYVKSRGKHGRFYFMTVNVSEFDRDIGNATNRPILRKLPLDTVYKTIDKIARYAA